MQNEPDNRRLSAGRAIAACVSRLLAQLSHAFWVPSMSYLAGVSPVNFARLVAEKIQRRQAKEAIERLQAAEAAEKDEMLSIAEDLSLHDSTALTALPEGLKVAGGLDLTGCPGLTAWPKGLKVKGIDEIHPNGDPDPELEVPEMSRRPF